MELSEEFIKANELSETQVKAVSELGAGQIASVKQEFEGLANENAEKIIDGAIAHTQKTTGFELPREKGEKNGDYLSRFATEYLSSAKAETAKAKADYEEKIKGVKGSEALAKEFESLKVANDDLKKKYADYDTLKESASKYDESIKQLTSLEKDLAFNSIRPKFPDEANKFEVDAKWGLFENKVLQEYDLKKVDKSWVGISKENQYKQVPLSDLLAKDTDIQKLTEGRKQTGPGGKEPISLTRIKGVPFEVPVNSSSIQRSELIKEQLTKEELEPTSQRYTDRFAELNLAIRKGVAA